MKTRWTMFSEEEILLEESGDIPTYSDSDSHWHSCVVLWWEVKPALMKGTEKSLGVRKLLKFKWLRQSTAFQRSQHPSSQFKSIFNIIGRTGGASLINYLCWGGCFSHSGFFFFFFEWSIFHKWLLTYAAICNPHKFIDSLSRALL